MTELSEGWKIALAWQNQLKDPDVVDELARQIDRGINEGPEWRDISMAPRDGTKILLAWDWDNVILVGYYVNDGWFCCWDDSSVIDKPTHWMPLPNPPSPEER